MTVEEDDVLKLEGVHCTDIEMLLLGFGAAGFAILYYDYFLTFSLEVERFWSRRFTLVSFAFFLNRYVLLLGHIPVIFEFFGTNQSSSLSLVKIAQLSQTPGILSVTDPSLISIGCNYFITKEQSRHFAFIWAAVLVFDAAVFGLTVAKVLRVGRTWQGSLFTLMLVDGALYFGVMFLCNLANIVVYWTWTGKSASKNASVTMTNILSATLMSRLMLHIRDPELLEARFN
ncbi:uncharacterized protein BXZ73DRAFT_105882 [Epithele typhae]|uniref:uncharacterized protein n=1 Tax=Epithele typhae TaxID=378194 RepID=UPI002008B02C|nr:uncharacterized protein BXZ73DRAFT_105882 [Epithele typhae]KAH9916252.1 hypothetical protein BXZ73DRAFT_105882 [Epithele typhae]